jgi:hypothetical protein
LAISADSAVTLARSSSCRASATRTRLISSVRSVSTAGAARVVSTADTANMAPITTATSASGQRSRVGPLACAAAAA